MELALKFLYEAFSCETGVIVGFAFRFSLLCVSALGANERGAERHERPRDRATQRERCEPDSGAEEPETGAAPAREDAETAVQVAAAHLGGADNAAAEPE